MFSGTFVNDKLLGKGKKEAIKHGDHVLLTAKKHGK